MLKSLLLRFGLKKLRRPGRYPTVLCEHRMNFCALWDEVRAHWIKIRRNLHPDVRGNEKRFARLCEIYFEIKRRMKEKGVLV